MLFRDKNVDDIECDESIIIFSITKEVDSINFRNAIIQSQLPFELSEFDKDIEEMIIKAKFEEDYYGYLLIENFLNLKKIVITEYSYSYSCRCSFHKWRIQFHVI